MSPWEISCGSRRVDYKCLQSGKFCWLAFTALDCHELVTAGDLKKTRSRSRSKRSRFRRARYRRRRLMAVLVLACLFFGIGTQAAAFFEAEEAGSAGAAKPAGSPGFVPAAFEGLLAQGDSSTFPANELRAPAKEPTKDLATSSAGSRPKRPGNPPAKWCSRGERKPDYRREEKRQPEKQDRKQPEKRQPEKPSRPRASRSTCSSLV